MGVAFALAAPAPLGHAIGDPLFEIGDRVRADAEFDEMLSPLSDQRPQFA
jgi:hypothetical protein